MIPPRFLDAGDGGLVVEFGGAIDPLAEAAVRALDEALAADPPPGVLERVPTYRSLLILFDPDETGADALERAVRDRLAHPGAARSGRRWLVPACYDPEVAEDLAEAAVKLGVTPGEVVRRHGEAVFRVAMYGFAPGYAYLSGCPRDLAVPRRATPRAPVPANSLMIAGGQALIASVPMPTGWYVVGRTAERSFAPERADPFLFAVGDEVRFEPVDLHVFRGLEQRAAAGERVARRIGGDGS